MIIFNRFSAAVSSIALMLGIFGPAFAFAAGPAPVGLLSISTNNFVILSKTGITNTGSHTSVITGNIGSSPITASAMNNVFCSEITGTIYGVDAAYVGSGSQTCFAGNPPLANKTLVDNAVLDMGTAYTDAAGRTGSDFTELGAGNIGGMTLAPGLYKWSTDVTIPTNVTLSGGANDVWIFQIAGNLDIASGPSVAGGTKVILTGGAQASNVFWQVGGVTGATLGTYSTFNGTILSAKQIIMQTGAVFNGRALAQTQVTLDANPVSSPVVSTPPPSPTPPPAVSRRDGTINVVKNVINDNGGTKVLADFPLFVDNRQVISGVTNDFEAPHDGYVVTETSDPNYMRSFSGDCDENGRFNLTPGQNQICIVTNDDIGPAVATPPVPPLIDLVKVPNPPALPNGPGPVMYTYTLRNIGTVPVANITMVGDTCSPITLLSGDANSDAKLDVNEVWTYRCSTTLSQTHTNTVVATGWANGLSAVDIANATVVVGTPVVPPLIHITKVPTRLSPFPFGGGDSMYVYTVTNPGVVPMRNVVVTDDKCSPVFGPYGDTNGNKLLDPGEGWAYACRTGVTKTTANTAVARGEANGFTVRDFAIATVVVSAPGLPNTGLPAKSAAPTALSSDKGISKAEAIASFHRSLGIGAEGDDVKTLQTVLEKKGFLVMPSGVAKGYFGGLTRSAIARYQMSVGLPSVGIFGPLTRAKIVSELGE